MSSPFGGHPTIDRYLLWLREAHGFQYQTGFGKTSLGKKFTCYRVFKEGGPVVHIVDRHGGLPLEPTYVDYLDRRLGVKSKWGTPSWS